MQRGDTRPAPLEGLRLDSRLLVAGAALVALLVGFALTRESVSAVDFALLAVALVTVVVLGRDELTALTIVAVSLLIDWYQILGAPPYLPVVAVALAAGVIGVLFLRQSAERPWVPIPGMRLWWALLILAAIPMVRGIGFREGITYYLQVFLTPLLMYLLGVGIARELDRVRWLFSLLSGLASLVAIHTIIIALTGTFLLATQRQSAYLASVSGFTLAGSTTARVGSFLGNPDWNGAFMAMMAFFPIGLFINTSARLARLLYLAEVGLILVALLFTFSTAAWVSVCAGLIALLVLLGRGRYGAYALAVICATLVVIFVVFPAQLRLLAQHASSQGGLSLRVGAWETAIRVIASHPLFGIGLGLNTYLQRAEPYRVALQYRALAHPHNAYLELGALAGLPVLVVFVIILGRALRLALANYRTVERRYQPLLAGALAALIVLCVNSLAINGWTLAPLAVIAWLVLGVLSSPALVKTQDAASTARPPRSDAASARAAPTSGSRAQT